MSASSTTSSTSLTSSSTSTSSLRLFDQLPPAQQKQIEALEGYADSLAIDGSNASSVLSSIDKHIAEMLKDKALWEKSEYELIGVQQQVAGMRWRISRIQSGEELDRDLSLDKEGLRLVIDRISKTTNETMFLNRGKVFCDAIKELMSSEIETNPENLNPSGARKLIGSSVALEIRGIRLVKISILSTLLQAEITPHSLNLHCVKLINNMIRKHDSQLYTLKTLTKMSGRNSDAKEAKYNAKIAKSLMDNHKIRIQLLVKYGEDLNSTPEIHHQLLTNLVYFDSVSDVDGLERVENWLLFLVNQGLNINLRWFTHDVNRVNQSIFERFISARTFSATRSVNLSQEEIEPVIRIVRTCVFLGATADDAVVKAAANSFPLACEQYTRLRSIRADIEKLNNKENVVKSMQCLQDVLLGDLVNVIGDYTVETSPQALYDLCEQEYERLYPPTSSSSTSTFTSTVSTIISYARNALGSLFARS